MQSACNFYTGRAAGFVIRVPDSPESSSHAIGDVALRWEPESAAGPFGPACFTASSSGLLLGAAGGLEGGHVEHALVANAAGL